MNTSKNTARIVGVLYIIGTVAGVLSVVFTKAILDAPDYLTQVSANENKIILGMLCILMMGLALAMVPVVMYPISKKYNETLALGYVVFRGALETTAYIATTVAGLLIITLSRLSVTADTLDVASFQVLGTLLQDAGDWLSVIVTIIFILGALMFYSVLYQSKLVPRWLSGWGLIATVPYLVAGFLVLFGLIGHMSTIDAVLRLPLGVQEMVLAGWLIIKGFDYSRK